MLSSKSPDLPRTFAFPHGLVRSGRATGCTSRPGFLPSELGQTGGTRPRLPSDSLHANPNAHLMLSPRQELASGSFSCPPKRPRAWAHVCRRHGGTQCAWAFISVSERSHVPSKYEGEFRLGCLNREGVPYPSEQPKKGRPCPAGVAQQLETRKQHPDTKRSGRFLVGAKPGLWALSR